MKYFTVVKVDQQNSRILEVIQTINPHWLRTVKLQENEGGRIALKLYHLLPDGAFSEIRPTKLNFWITIQWQNDDLVKR